MSELTHLDADGRARMVDVGAKPETDREAVARGRLVTTPEVVRLVAADDRWPPPASPASRAPSARATSSRSATRCR